MNTEIEHETKFLLSINRNGGWSRIAMEILTDKAIRQDGVGDHLITYYDDQDDSLLKAGHTFRLTLRRKDGIDKHRATLKLNRSNTNTVRTCEEFHWPLSKELSPFLNSINTFDFPLDMKIIFFSAYIANITFEKKCWIRVKRYTLDINGVNCNLDICKTNKGVYFEELETEDPITEEWIDFLRARYGVNWLSNVNKYKRTRLVNEM